MGLNIKRHQAMFMHDWRDKIGQLKQLIMPVISGKVIAYEIYTDMIKNLIRKCRVGNTIHGERFIVKLK